MLKAFLKSILQAHHSNRYPCIGIGFHALPDGHADKLKRSSILLSYGTETFLGDVY